MAHDDGLKHSVVVGFDGAVGDTGGVDDRDSATLTVSTQVQVVLEQLAEQLPSVGGQSGLELFVGEPGGLGAGEEVDNGAVASARGGERLTQLRRCKSPTSVSRPTLPSASSLWRAAR